MRLQDPDGNERYVSQPIYSLVTIFFNNSALNLFIVKKCFIKDKCKYESDNLTKYLKKIKYFLTKTSIINKNNLLKYKLTYVK